MRYLYRISHGSYDGGKSIELSHTRKIGKREFNNMFVEATLELLLNRRESYIYHRLHYTIEKENILKEKKSALLMKRLKE